MFRVNFHFMLTSTLLFFVPIDAQQESTRAATWSQLRAYRHSRASINLQSEYLTRQRSVLSAGRPVSGYKDFQNRVSHTPSTATINFGKTLT